VSDASDTSAESSDVPPAGLVERILRAIARVGFPTGIEVNERIAYERSG
jgi:hypothetical protein